MDNDKVHILLERIKDGCKDSMGELYDYTYSDIYRYIYSITLNNEYTKDLAHDTYIQVYKNIYSYKGKGHAVAWIITITRNICYMFLRRNNKVITVDYELELSCDDYEKIKDSLLLEMVLKELNDVEREIVVLHVIEGLTFLEISKVMGMRLSTILSKYHRCIKRLKDIYGGVDNER